MNSLVDHQQHAAQFTGAVPAKCLVCGNPIGEQCFCRIQREAGDPITLCNPNCTMQYLDSARPPADEHEQALRAYEKTVHLFIGEDKAWL